MKRVTQDGISSKVEATTGLVREPVAKSFAADDMVAPEEPDPSMFAELVEMDWAFCVRYRSGLRKSAVARANQNAHSIDGIRILIVTESVPRWQQIAA